MLMPVLLWLKLNPAADDAGATADDDDDDDETIKKLAISRNNVAKVMRLG